MAGPRVDTSRAPNPAAAGGEFSKAFATVMDAMQTARQVAAAEEQVRAQERAKAADNQGKLLEGVFNKRAAEVGVSQAGDEMADILGDYFTSQGGRGDLLAKTLRDTYARGEESPQVGAMRLGRVLFNANPSQLQQINQSLVQMEAAPAAITTPERTTTDPEAFAPLPTFKPEDVAKTLMVGPTPATKVEQTMTAFDDAMKAVNEAGDDPKSLLNAVSKLDRMNRVTKSGSTKEAQGEAWWRGAFGDSRVEGWKAAFGETWMRDVVDVMLGTRGERIQVEGRGGGGMEAYFPLLIAMMGNKSDKDIAQLRADVDRDTNASREATAKADQERKEREAHLKELSDQIQKTQDKIGAIKNEYKDKDPKGYLKDERWSLNMKILGRLLSQYTGEPAEMLTEKIRDETGRSGFYSGLRGLFPGLPAAAPGTFFGPRSEEDVPVDIIQSGTSTAPTSGPTPSALSPGTGGLRRTTTTPANVRDLANKYAP